MTEPEPIWFIGESDLLEWEILAGTAARLRGTGWFVTITAQDKSTRRQLSGLPNLIAVKHDHVLFVECKTARGKLNDAQKHWRECIAQHKGPHLRHIVVRHPKMIEEWLAPGRGAWREEQCGE